MNARELIHALSAEWVDQDAQVELWACSLDGDGFRLHVITKVTSMSRKGQSYTTCTIEPMEPE